MKRPKGLSLKAWTHRAFAVTTVPPSATAKARYRLS